MIFVARPPMLNSSQLGKLSDVLIAAGQLAAGAMVGAFLVPGFVAPRGVLVNF